MYKKVLEYITCPACQEKLNIISKIEKNGEIIEGFSDAAIIIHGKWRKELLILSQKNRRKQINGVSHMKK